MVDRDDWLIGEDITLNGQPMRSMQNPANGKNSILDGWQPKHMSELVNGDDLDYFVNRDNEGVHINSGIGNYAYYLYATNISKDKAEQVYYRALKEYLNKLSKFIDLRIAVVQSAKDLFGDNSPEAIKASEAFDAVGIYEEEQIDYTQDYEENPGQEYLISYDTNEMDENTLYQSSAEGTDFAAITTTDMKGKVSISDDGTVAVFVSKDHKIRAIDLNTFNEVILSDDPFWDNVAISKDGKRLAGISTEIDTAIYVYDFISQQWTKYILYNPTTSNDNSNSGGVLYADVIEFDQTGEYLIYDAYNYLNSNTSEDIYYWDIGFINIWNNKENSFGNGKISKLYESLRENVSIGNPVFSKNSPYIIAFDFFDEKNDEFAIIGANLIDGEIEDIYLNSILGYPSFSTNDNYIAFSALNTSEEEVVAKIGLAENKISGTGSASAIINSAKWPVFYASGQRLLGLKPTSNFTADIKAGNAPLKIIFFDLSINNPTSWKWSFERGSPNISNEQNPEISYNTPGLYNVTLTTQNPYGSDTKKKTSYILISKSSGVKEVNLNSVQFFPNPVNDILTIISGENFSVSLYDLNRKEIIHEKNRTSLDLSGLNSGIYILEVICEKQVIREKILKQ